MTDFNDDRTVAFTDNLAPGKDRSAAALADVPRASLICTDRTQVDSPLPGDGVIHLVPGAEQTVGRGDTCTYPIGSRKLSRQHARVFAGVGAWGVEDLNSTNGVRVNDQKVTTAWLKHGDVVKFGPIPFRFEVARPETAAAAAAAAAAQPAAGGGDGEHTMIFTGAQGAKAAEVMLKAVREAEKGDGDVPQAIVPTAPVKKPDAKAAAPQARSSRPVLLIVAAVLVLALIIGGGVIYYPIFKRNQEISSVLERGNRIVDRVILHARDVTGGATLDGTYLEDIKALKPVIDDSGQALGDPPDSRELADLYARSHLLAFERTFTEIINRSDVSSDALKTLNKLAFKLRTELDRIDGQLPRLTTGADQSPLKTAANLADLASILIDYRIFSRQFAPAAAAGGEQALPSLDDINKVDARRKTLTEYAKTYHQVLTRDYRLFNAVIEDINNHDIAQIDHWRQLQGARH